MTTVTLMIFMIGLAVLAAAMIYAAVSYLRFYRREHFTCPKCGCSFRPKVLKMIFSVNAVEGKIIQCPNCGKREYMEPKQDRQEE